MTTFSIKKILNCLVRDTKNHEDLTEMFREALKELYEYRNKTIDIVSDNIIISGPDWYYWFIADVWSPTENYQIEENWSSRELAEIIKDL